MNKYYDENAVAFFDSTVGVDMAPIYEKFLPHVAKGGLILDAGCGSGRDARYFLASGYDVTAFDASRELCGLATDYLGKEVLWLRFEDIQWEEQFDAVWACASLLHVPQIQLAETFSKLTRAMKAGAVMYVSFKQGQGERQVGGRHFTDLTQDRLRDLVASIEGLQFIEQWLTEDRRPGREEIWLNALLRKWGAVPLVEV